MSDLSDPTVELVAEFGKKYIWWEAIDGAPHPPERVIAQVMNLGTYEDIRCLERAVKPERLADIMRHAQPGWFSPRSWAFWRGRLSRSALVPIAAEPPIRTFDVGIL